MEKGWPVGLPSHEENLGYASSGVTLLEVLVYVDVNMIGVYFVKETKAVFLCRWLLANHSRTNACKTPNIYLINPST